MTGSFEKAKRLARRIAHASWGELHFRSKQLLLNRRDGLFYRLREARPLSTTRNVPTAPSKAPRFFFSPADLSLTAEILQQRFPETAAAIVALADRTCAHRFDLLGYENLSFGEPIDWSLDPVHQKRAPRDVWYNIPYLDFSSVGDVKITWELNRQQHFLTLGKAYQLTRDEKYAREFAAQFRDWLARNPYPIGVNWASSLEVSFRSLSWLWARNLFAGSPVLSPNFDCELLLALERNACFIERNLSYYFSPNTHLLGEGVALFFIGMLCPGLRGAKVWRDRGWEIVLGAARRQVRPDGGYFEQSTYYHVYALDFFLHARTLAHVNDFPVPLVVDRTIVAMLDYLSALCVAGPPPRFGDDDGGRLFDPSRNRSEHLTDPLSTGSVLFQRPDFKAAAGTLREETLWLLGPASAGEFDRLPKIIPAVHSRAFPQTGTYVLADKGMQITMDAGPLGSARGGHGHADSLSLCLSVNGTECFSDPGTGSYIGSRGIRDSFRGTRSHNALAIDGLDQAEMVDPFAWARFPESRVERWVAGESFDFLEASHDGYTRLPSPVRHRRSVFFVKGHFCLVLDAAEGRGRHSLEIFWHSAGEQCELDALHRAVARAGETTFAVVSAIDAEWKTELIRTPRSPSYGRLDSRFSIRCYAEADLPVEAAFLLVPRLAREEDLGTLRRLAGESLGLRAFQYVTGAKRHTWFFAPTASPWALGEFSSDARVAYCAQDRDGEIESVVVCEGSFFARHGQNQFSSEGARPRIEFQRKEDRTEIIPPGAAQLSIPEGVSRADSPLQISAAPVPPVRARV